ALGPLRRDVIPLYQRWFNDFGTLRTLAIPPRPLTLEGETAWYEHAAIGDASSVQFTIYEAAAWRPIGNALWRDIDYRNRTAAMAIFIGDAADRGKGYGTEATRLMLDYAFTALGLHSVMLTCYAFNLAGQRAYEKAGFRECGRRHECHWMGGRFWDEIYMECLASEFISPLLARIFAPDVPRQS
ncbi:MAG: GNAT family N-acetyltransferase, partial [Thermomicrobia bacterium]|nr:GNAT family N-acetyltransferase [Thermomicrobia bacterium]